MTLTGSTIYLHNWRRPLPLRVQNRKVVGPYMYTVPTAGRGLGRGYYASDDQGTTGDATFRLRSCERPARVNGWYCDDMQDQTITACVLRLPRGRGFLAGWTMGKGMASSVDFDLYAEERDAWYAADSMAEHAAEREREYQAEQDAKREEEA